MSNLVENLQRALYEALSEYNELKNIVSGIYTTIINNIKLPYIHISDIKIKKAPWNNSNCAQCEFTMNAYTESHDNLLCLKITDLLEQAINANNFLTKLQTNHLIVANSEIVHTSIMQNSKTLTWEGQLKVSIFIENTNKA